jgi:NADPH-dependent ferric siderophore reductase
VVALLGPGSGRLPPAESILMIGDESALPAIARIAAEVPAGTSIKAIIEVSGAEEEQPLPSAGLLDVRWLHRNRYPAGATGTLSREGIEAILASSAETFVWVACEKADVRAIRACLKDRNHDKSRTYAAWYWEK